MLRSRLGMVYYKEIVEILQCLLEPPLDRALEDAEESRRRAVGWVGVRTGKISAQAVKALRELSGAGMMDCKKALAENDSNVEKAQEWLRKKGMASADKKASRIAADGAVHAYIHAGSRIGVLVEVNCETDFVAKGDTFKAIVANIAMQIAAFPNVEYVSSADVDPEWIEKERAIEMGKEDLQSKPENIRAKMVEGRINKLKTEKSLMDQPFIMDNTKTVEEFLKENIGTIGEKISVRRFQRFNLGEGIEKRSEDFAAEVAAATAVKAPAPPKEEKKEAATEEKKEAATEEAKPTVAVSAKAVKALRDMSGAGMMDCKKALAENDNDVEKAQEWLRKKGMASADKKASRIAADGAVGAYIHAGSRIGVMVEVNCETDFVAKGDTFKAIVADIAMQIAAFPNVEYVSSADVDPKFIEKERAIEMGKEDLQSKPESIRAKMVEGRINKLKTEKSLMDQPYIKDSTKTVEQFLKENIGTIGEKISVRRFQRFNLGEGIEKRSEDFAAEVAAAMGN
jgi:elongation factor Ts